MWELFINVALVWGLAFLAGVSVVGVVAFFIWCAAGVVWLVKYYRGDYK